LREFDEDLDLTGVPCPQNAARTLLRLAMMDSGDVLRVTLDDGEPIDLVPDSVEDEAHSILERHQLEDTRWVLWIEAD